MHVLITGGCGFIGSHCAVALVRDGHSVTLFDNLANSNEGVLPRIRKLVAASDAVASGADADDAASRVHFIRGDITNALDLDGALGGRRVDAIVHAAALKSVGESASRPLDYYSTNVGGMATTLAAAARHDVKLFVFSSSATVYRPDAPPPLAESAPVELAAATNVYARTKIVAESLMRDAAAADPALVAVALRYFNPIGAHASGELGEDPRGVPNNLMPIVAQVAVGRRSHVGIFGSDYATADGTGVRDYIHVEDVAEGHVKALTTPTTAGFHAINLGTGRGSSVLEVIAAFRAASGVDIATKMEPRRAGDVAACFCDPSEARRRYGWTATRTLEQAAAHAWAFQQANPKGYEG